LNKINWFKKCIQGSKSRKNILQGGNLKKIITGSNTKLAYFAGGKDLLTLPFLYHFYSQHTRNDFFIFSWSGYQELAKSLVGKWPLVGCFNFQVSHIVHWQLKNRVLHCPNMTFQLINYVTHKHLSEFSLWSKLVSSFIAYI
jgi:hypothetical protein